MTIVPQNQPTTTDLVYVLSGRLDMGWTLIDAETDPARKASLEGHWVDLLRDYERAYDEATAGNAEVSR